MNREYGYNWGHLWTALIAVVAAIIFVVWKQGNLNEVYWAGIGIFILFFISKQTLPLCKVMLTESEIHIFFLSPLRFSQRLRFDEIDSYTEFAIQRKEKKVLIGGHLKPKDRKQIMLLNLGTKNFEELNSTLSELFAKDEKNA
jgi:hypothetical protein